MNLEEWIASRTPAPPPALAGRIRDAVAEAVAGAGNEAGTDPFDVLVEAARGILETLPGGRSGALDLLAADALLSYAFEAAADDCDSLAERADSAIGRIASLA